MAARMNLKTLFAALACSALGACDQPANPPKADPKPPAKPDPAPQPAPQPTPKTPPQPASTSSDPDPMTTPANPTLPIEKVTIAGKTFRLELAATNEQRFHGLSGRAAIAADGGMLFAFPASQVQVQGFVMRDCPVGIDIIYLDPTGRITATAKMVPEPARSADEKSLDPRTGVNARYEARLKQYSSHYPAQFVIELAANTLDTLNVKAGEKIELDLDRLKKLAQ